MPKLSLSLSQLHFVYFENRKIEIHIEIFKSKASNRKLFTIQKSENERLQQILFQVGHRKVYTLATKSGSFCTFILNLMRLYLNLHLFWLKESTMILRIINLMAHLSISSRRVSEIQHIY